jgi:hypothetical protein
MMDGMIRIRKDYLLKVAAVDPAHLTEEQAKEMLAALQSDICEFIMRDEESERLCNAVQRWLDDNEELYA